MSMLRALDAECNLTHQICPNCGARGRFAPHGRYTRNLVKLILGIPVDTVLEVKRVRCLSCKVTHAIIPYDVVPYCQHSTTLSARLFELRHRRRYTVVEVCDELGISPTTFYRIHNRSLGRLITLVFASKGIVTISGLFKDTVKLVSAHLALHKIKPFESGRLSPAFFDT